MKTNRIVTAAMLFALLLAPMYGRSSSRRSDSPRTTHSSSHRSRSPHSSSPKATGRSQHARVAKTESHLPKHTSSVKCVSCVRDARGRIHRSATAKHDFQRSHPCPSTNKSSGACPGYVVDHRVPLKRGGADHPSNMDWQTKAEAKAKDRVE